MLMLVLFSVQRNLDNILTHIYVTGTLLNNLFDSECSFDNKLMSIKNFSVDC